MNDDTLVIGDGSEYLGFGPTAESGLTLNQLTVWFNEIKLQPKWRRRADREMDYKDANQLDSDVLAAMAESGIPPAVDPCIGPALETVLGDVAKTKTDWRVLPDGVDEGDDVAKALNWKLNRAERASGADAAIEAAIETQFPVGIGWVEVAREDNPFLDPYRCSCIHRNEIWWDMKTSHSAREAAKRFLRNGRYLIRRKWVDRRQATMLFPDHEELITHAIGGWFNFTTMQSLEGGTSTTLASAYEDERGWSIEEQEWRDPTFARVALFEVWYRIWERALVLKLPTGKVVEFDKSNEAHQIAVATGAEVQSTVISKVRMAWYLGPHRLFDGPSPYPHSMFPYVPFFGYIEDRTGVPYGKIRGMMYLQDQVNAMASRAQWGLSAVRTVRTRGAVLMDDEEFRQEVGNVAADIVLDPDAMAQPGARFEVERDFQFSAEQHRRLADSKIAIRQVAGIYAAYEGEASSSQSGVAFHGQVEQSKTGQANILENAKESRALVGELLLSLIIEDMLDKEETVTIPGDALKEDQVIKLNVPTVDPVTGFRYLSNDISRVRLKVDLDNVPSTPSFRSQQLNAMSEVVKACPPEFQRVLMPYLLTLMDAPFKDDIVRAIKEAAQAPTQEQIDAQIQQAVKDALLKAGFEQKAQELAQKEKLVDAQVAKLRAETTNENVTAMFSATNAGANIAAQAAVAPLADQLLQSAGFVDANAAPIVPSVPAGIPVNPIPENTSPNFPPRGPSPDVGLNEGIETGFA